MPTSKPRSSAMRAEIGSNTEPGCTQRLPARIARKRLRRSVQFMCSPPFGAEPSKGIAAMQDRISTGKRSRPKPWPLKGPERSVCLQGRHGVRCIRPNKTSAQGKCHVRRSRPANHSDRQPEEDHRRGGDRRCPRILRLLPDRLRAGLRHRAVEAHLRAVGHRADVVGPRRHHRRLCLGLAGRPHRPAQGLHRHGAELLDRHRPALFHAGQWLGLPDDLALLRRFRRRRPLLRRPAAGAGVHALVQARLGRRAGNLRHPARRRHGCRAGRLHGRRPVARCCSPSACCRR